MTVPGRHCAGARSYLDWSPAGFGPDPIPACRAEARVVSRTSRSPAPEWDETFQMLLSEPLNATLTDAEATGTILDDEPVPAQGTGFLGLLFGSLVLVYCRGVRQGIPACRAR